MKAVSFLLVCYFACSTVVAQHPGSFFGYEYAVTSWSSANGLPQNSISSIAQDRYGYLWMATLEGIVRFDGVRFKVYDRSWNREIPSDRITSMLMENDAHNTIWAGTEGFGLFRLRNDSVTVFGTEDGLHNHHVRVITFDAAHNVWVGTSQGGVFKLVDDRLVQAQFPELNDLAILSLLDTGNGVAIGTNRGLFIFRDNVLKPILARGGDTLTINTIIRASNGGFWIGTSNGLYALENDELTRINLPSLQIQAVWSLFEDKKTNTLWIGGHSEGLARLSLQTGIVQHYQGSSILKNAPIWCIFRDLEESIWIGTHGKGLHRFTGGKFFNFTAAHGLTDDFVWSISVNMQQGDVWIGTNRGLNVLRLGHIISFTQKEGLPNAGVVSVLVDSKETVWAGTFGSGLYKKEKQAVRFHPVSIVPSTAVHYATYEDAGDVFISSDRGIFRASGNKIELYIPEHVLSHLEVRGFLRVNNELLFATNYGVRFWDGTSLELHPEYSEIGAVAIRHLYDDGQGVIWIATEGRGIYLKDAMGVFGFNTFDYGMYDDFISFITYDSYTNTMWFTCNKGVFSVYRDEFIAAREQSEPLLLGVQVFGTDQGMRSREVNGGVQPSAFQTPNGNIYLPTLGGVSLFNPRVMSLNATPPIGVITSVELDEKIIKPETQLRIPPHVTRVAIEYNGLSLVAPNQNKFRYMLEGFDKRWTEVTNKRRISYTNLPPGEYTFVMYASNNDGIWNKEPLRYTIIKEGYIYQQKWFYLFVLLIAVVGTMVFIAIRASIRHKRERMLKQLVEERTIQLELEKARYVEAMHELAIANEQLEETNLAKIQFMNIVAHDLRNPLNGVFGFAQILQDEYGKDADLKQIGEMLMESSQKMLNLIDRLLGQKAMSERQITLEIKPVDLSFMAQKTVSGLQDIARKKHQRITLEAPHSLYVDADEFWLREAMDNMLSNAIKYSPKGKDIYVSVSAVDGKGRFEIKDQGPGLKDEDIKSMFQEFQRLSAQPTDNEKSTGFGLSIVKRIIDLHKGDMVVNNNEFGGASFAFELTLSAYTPET